jgi:hypothetical protein
MLERYQAEIEAKADPTDPRWQVPTAFVIPNTVTGTAIIREVTELLKQSLFI